MRLLFVGHLGRAHDDEILFAKPVRVQRFSVVPHSTLAHDVVATTQQEPFEFELSFQKKDAKELSQIHKGPVSRGGTCDVKERVVTQKLAFRGDYYRVCVAVYGELADLKEEARLEREALAAEKAKNAKPKPPPEFYEAPSRDGARLLLDPVVDRLLRGEQQDATTIPSSLEDEAEDEWPDNVTPQQALEKLPSSNWEALIQCCSANIASEDYETQLAAFQLIDQACSAGDASLASMALVDSMQTASSILDEEYAPPRLVESVAGALRSLAEASPDAASRLDTAPVVRRLLRDSPIMRPAFLRDANRFLRRCGLVRALASLRDAAASCLATPTWPRLRDATGACDAVRALLERACKDAAARSVTEGWGASEPVVDARLLDVLLRGRLAASCAALAAATSDCVAKDFMDAATRRDALASIAPCEAALSALVHLLNDAEGGGAVWALCPKAANAFVECCSISDLVDTVQTQRLTYTLARSLPDAPVKRPEAFEMSAPLPGIDKSDKDEGPPTRAELLSAIRFVAESNDCSSMTRAVCETEGAFDCILQASSDPASAEHALALLSLFGEAAPASACRLLTLKRSEVRSKLCGDGDPAPASAAARALLKEESREVTCASVQDVARRLRILARTTETVFSLEEDDDALVTTCCNTAACVAKDIGEVDKEEDYEGLSYGREALDHEASLRVATCGLSALNARLRARRIVAATTNDTESFRSLLSAAIKRRLLSPTDPSGVFRVLDAVSARVVLLRGDVPPPLLGDVSDQVNTAANRVSALGVDGEEDYDEDVEPVHTEEGFSALQRCLDTGLAACALADTLLASIRCSEQWRDEADVLDVLLKCISSLCITFGPLLHERACDDGMEDEAELKPVETPLYLQAKSLAEHLVLLLRKYWSTTWSPSSLCKAVAKLARSSPASWLGCASALERCLPRRAPCLPSSSQDVADLDDGGYVGYSLGLRDSLEDDRADARRAALQACLDGRRGARNHARALQETAQRAQRSKWDESVTDDVIQFAVKCLESAAKALQGVGSELVAGLIDLGPVSGAKTASYLLLEARAAVQCGKAKDAKAYAARAETVRARVPFRRHRRDYATPSTRPLRSRTGPREAGRDVWGARELRGLAPRGAIAHGRARDVLFLIR
jgi:hypothetical protein